MGSVTLSLAVFVLVYLFITFELVNKAVAAALETEGVPHLVVPVHDLCHYQGQANKIFVGALTITPDRKVVAPIGTANVLSICHLAGVKSYLFATIVNEYGVVPKDVVGPDGHRLLDPHPLTDRIAPFS